MYTPPGSTSVGFNFTSGSYTPPAPTVVAFSFPPSGSGGGGGGGTSASKGIALLIGL